MLHASLHVSSQSDKPSTLPLAFTSARAQASRSVNHLPRRRACACSILALSPGGASYGVALSSRDGRSTWVQGGQRPDELSSQHGRWIPGVPRTYDTSGDFCCAFIAHLCTHIHVHCHGIAWQYHGRPGHGNAMAMSAQQPVPSSIHTPPLLFPVHLHSPPFFSAGARFGAMRKSREKETSKGRLDRGKLYGRRGQPPNSYLRCFCSQLRVPGCSGQRVQGALCTFES